MCMTENLFESLGIVCFVPSNSKPSMIYTLDGGSPPEFFRWYTNDRFVLFDEKNV